jgi:selenide,water dikinase
MLQSNREAAKVLSKHELHACTDVTGYGFLGHLYNILFASGMAATVQASRVPAYPSLVEISYPDQSRQALHNFAYVKPYLTLSVNINPLLEALLFDSQVSGGLLICAPPNAVDGICGGLSTTGFVPAIVGQVGSGSPGTIEVV